MKILGLFIENYGSFLHRHYINLADRGLVSVEGQNLDEPRSGNNGAGKTTWSDALYWCLWGEHPRGDDAETVVHHLSRTGCTVSVQIKDDDGHLLQITRSREVPGVPAGPRIFLDGEEKTALDAKATQADIQKRLGLDKEVFLAVVLFAQGDHWQFADGTDTERKELLTRILPELQEVDGWADTVEGLLVDAVDARKVAQEKLITAQAQLEALRNQDPAPRVAHWERERQARLDSGRAEFERADARLRQMQAEMAALPPVPPDPPPPSQAELALTAEWAVLPPVPASAGTTPEGALLQAERDSWGPLPEAPPPTPQDPELVLGRERVRSLDADIATRQDRLADLRARVRAAMDTEARLLDPRATTCATCGQALSPATRAHVNGQIQAVRESIRTLTETGVSEKAALDGILAQRAEVQRGIQEVEGRVQASVAAQSQFRAAREMEAQRRAQVEHRIQAELRTADAGRRAALAHRESLSARMAAERRATEAWVAALREKVAAIDRQMRVVAGDVERAVAMGQRIAAEVNPYHAEVDAWRERVSGLQMGVSAAEAAMVETQKRVAGLEFWKHGFGPKGLKSYLLDARLGEMAAEANRWVQLLTGGTTWVEFATQRQVGKGKARKLRDDFSITVKRSFRDGTVVSQNYRSFSGGEKRRIAMGIDFGLSRLVAKRSSRAYDLLILDEVFQHLDTGGKEAVAEMLGILAAEKSSIFIIDHDAEFAHLFRNKMVVRKQNRASRVVGGSYFGPESSDAQGRVGEDAESLARGRFLANHPAFPGAPTPR